MRRARGVAGRSNRASADVIDPNEGRYLRTLLRRAFSLLDERRRRQLLEEIERIGLDLRREATFEDLRTVGFGGKASGSAGSGCAIAIDIHVLRGEVFVGGVLETLARSEFAILIALGRRSRAYSVVELGDLLYPELDADNAANRLRVYVHRIRRRLGRGAIVAEAGGYRLGSAVDVDVRHLSVPSAPDDRTAIDAKIALLCASHSYSESELDAFALRLRLPQALVWELRESLARFRRICSERVPGHGLLDL